MGRKLIALFFFFFFFFFFSSSSVTDQGPRLDMTIIGSLTTDLTVAIETGPTLLEREHELTELGAAINEARHGRGQVVLVEAPAGLGKTSLLQSGVPDRRRSGLYLPASARQRARARLRLRLRAAAAGARRREASDLSATACSRAPPLCRSRCSPRPAADCRLLRRQLVLDAARPVLAGQQPHRRRPVALLVDDLHWCDAESLRFLAYLAPRLDGLPLAVLASTRPGEGVVARPGPAGGGARDDGAAARDR